MVLSAAFLKILAALIAAISQILLKSSTLRKHNSAVKEYFNMWVLSAYFLFFLTTGLNLWAFMFWKNLSSRFIYISFLFFAFSSLHNQKLSSKKKRHFFVSTKQTSYDFIFFIIKFALRCVKYCIYSICLKCR